MFGRSHRRLFSLAASAGLAAWIGLMPATVSAAPSLPPPPLARPDLTMAYTGDVTVARGANFTHVMNVSNAGATTAANQTFYVVGAMPAGFQILTMSGKNGVTCEFDNEGQIIQHPDFGKPFPLWVCRVTRPMLTGTSAVLIASVRAPSTPDEYPLFGYADYTDVVKEANEGNNATEPKIRVQ